MTTESTIDDARSFTPVPSFAASSMLTADSASSVPGTATAIGVPVATNGELPTVLGVGRAVLDATGFDGKVGSCSCFPAEDGRLTVAVGIGELDHLDAAALRNAAAAFARAVAAHDRLAFVLGEGFPTPAAVGAQAVVEGVLLARYAYDPLRRMPKGRPVLSVTVVTSAGEEHSARSGAVRGRLFASATMIARDLASTPHSHLTAMRMAEVAEQIGAERGFEVEVFDRDALAAMGCGGLLAVNAGSVEPPCMVKLTYRPTEPTGRLALVGKGIMYDSGGISLKPSDMVHARMKNDMTGAAAILAVFACLAELEATTAVTGYLMCTDNMPSGTATALGDVITIRGGTTVEIIDTDAEGRLVMSDALVLAAEEQNDAIVDIATLTGSVMRALGTDVAGLFGTDQGLVEQVSAAATATDELVWQLPLHRPYRTILESQVADLVNCGPIGKPDGIVAALFLSEFVGETPWAHIDIAGTAWNETDSSWRTEGASGFGARLLLDFVLRFVPPTG